MSDDDEELDRLLAELRRRCDEQTAERARQMLDSMDEIQPVEIGDQHVVLLGFEGNVDAVWAVVNRPDTLLRPLPQRPSVAKVDLDPVAVSMPVATYRREGEFTYRRES
jgi:hypothetical protein